MSLLKDSLSGKSSTILYRRYLEHPTNSNSHMALIRFEIDGWSSVFFALGRTRYIAGARALQKYTDFCRAHEVAYTDEDNRLVQANDDDHEYSINDDAYADEYSED